MVELTFSKVLELTARTKPKKKQKPSRTKEQNREYQRNRRAKLRAKLAAYLDSESANVPIWQSWR